MAKFKLNFKKPQKNPMTAIKAFAADKMAALKKTQNATTIAIDPDNMIFHFYTMAGGDRGTIKHQIKNFTGELYDQAFFKRFKQALASFVSENPVEGIRRVTVVLPDSAVLTDMIKIPTMRGVGKTQKSLTVTLRGLYRNFDELALAFYPAAQNRQHTTYALAAVQKRIVSQIYTACSENSMLVETLTFASAATANAVSVLLPKQKTASYLFLDMKEAVTHFTFVAGGRAVGFYQLPFGSSFLSGEKVTQEDMLFDHSYAELAVLNAKEKAKSKKLTVMSVDGVAGALDEEPLEEVIALEDTPLPIAEEAVPEDGAEPEELEEDFEEEEEEVAPSAVNMPETAVRMSSPKLFVRKTARRLPKFMQRPIAETPEDILYENFRVFVKWALTLIESNDRLTEIGAPACVFVNMPKPLYSVLDRVNAEAAENKITFTPFVLAPADVAFAEHLTLFGGLYPGQLAAGKF